MTSSDDGPSGTDGDESPVPDWLRSLDRRHFIGGVAGFGLGAGAVGLQDESQPEAPESTTDNTVTTTTQTGEAGPVESLTVRDLRLLETPFVDVTSYGVVGDGATDDSGPFREAVAAATPHGVLYVPYDTRILLENPVDIDLSGAGHNRFSFVCHGSITPAPRLTDAIRIVDGARIYVFARIQGGGETVETDSAITVEGGGASLFEGQATNYDGTVYTFRDTGTYSVGYLRTTSCGQSIAVFDASPMGEIGDVFDVGPVRAPEFHATSDITINQYENFVGSNCEQGILFDQCLSIFADTIAVGGSASVPTFEMDHSRHAFFNALHLGGASDVAGRIDNVRYSSFQVVCNHTDTGIVYDGRWSDGNRFFVNGRNITNKGLVVGDDISEGYHYISGNVVGNDATGIEVQTRNARIHLDHVYAVRNDVDVVLPDGSNEVRVTDSTIESMIGAPKTINHLGIAAVDGTTPPPEEWDIGDVVEVTSPDGEGVDGLYLKSRDGSWRRIDRAG